MLHFPSTLKSNAQSSLPRRTDSLNATQQKSGSNPIFLKIEEELHDARRVRAHGQEDDLRLALDMVINRVTELSTLLTESYKTHAELEVQLNVAKSNLALVISNNEMLEDALRRDSSGSSKEVGWRRRSGKDGDPSQERQSLEEWHQVTEPSSGNESGSGSSMSSPQISTVFPTPTANAAQENGRFFKFRFGSNPSSSRPVSRPSTPSTAPTHSPQIPSQFTSPTIPTIPPQVAKELEELSVQLGKERSARKTAEEEKARVEAEIESLSQALFEEANKMVAMERIKLAETEEELKEQKSEKEALKRALRLIEAENHALRTENSVSSNPVSGSESHNGSIHISRSRSSSEVAIKSRPTSPIPNSTDPDPVSTPSELGQERALDVPSSETSTTKHPEATPKGPQMLSLPPPSTFTPELDYSSPWADVPSSSSTPPAQAEPETSIYAAAALATR